MVIPSKQLSLCQQYYEQASNFNTKHLNVDLYQFDNKQSSMNFGPQFISPPLLYYLIYPSNYYITASQTQSQPFHATNPDMNQSSPKLQFQTQKPSIIVTREDLIEEGYENSKKAWTEEQDQLLMKLCSNPKALFDQIAPFLHGRNAKMCYSRYRRLTNQSKECWTKCDNERLRSLVEEFGENNWREFLPFFPNRNHKQLKDHYQNYLQPNIDTSEWTVEEDLELIRLINQHGQNWKYIQTLMPRRSRNQLKNRFFGRIKRINAKKLQISQKNQVSELNKLSLLTI